MEFCILWKILTLNIRQMCTKEFGCRPPQEENLLGICKLVFFWKTLTSQVTYDFLWVPIVKLLLGNLTKSLCIFWKKTPEYFQMRSLQCWTISTVKVYFRIKTLEHEVPYDLLCFWIIEQILIKIWCIFAVLLSFLSR